MVEQQHLIAPIEHDRPGRGREGRLRHPDQPPTGPPGHPPPDLAEQGIVHPGAILTGWCRKRRRISRIGTRRDFSLATFGGTIVCFRCIQEDARTDALDGRAGFTQMRLKISALMFAAFVSVGCGASGSSPLVARAQTTDGRPATGATISIAAVGDIMLASPYPDDTRMPPNDGAGMLEAVIPVLSAADIAFGNMEGPIVDSGDSAKCKPKKPEPTATPVPDPSATPKKPEPVRCYAFRMPTRYAKYLKEAGFDVMSVANNHALDFGDAGRLSTMRTLQSSGIKHAGADRAKLAYTIVEVKGQKVAFIGFAHNTVSPNVNDLVTA